MNKFMLFVVVVHAVSCNIAIAQSKYLTPRLLDALRSAKGDAQAMVMAEEDIVTLGNYLGQIENLKRPRLGMTADETFDLQRVTIAMRALGGTRWAQFQRGFHQYRNLPKDRLGLYSDSGPIHLLIQKGESFIGPFDENDVEADQMLRMYGFSQYVNGNMIDFNTMLLNFALHDIEKLTEENADLKTRVRLLEELNESQDAQNTAIIDRLNKLERQVAELSTLVQP